MQEEEARRGSEGARDRARESDSDRKRGGERARARDRQTDRQTDRDSEGEYRHLVRFGTKHADTMQAPVAEAVHVQLVAFCVYVCAAWQRGVGWLSGGQ